MTSPKEYRQFGKECGKQAAETNDKRLRELLNETARTWMRIALNVERAGSLKADEAHFPVITAASLAPLIVTSIWWVVPSAVATVTSSCSVPPVLSA